ncbi:hypothetical protein GPNCGGLF_LOCUS671 [Methylorubrum aminovorans]
MAQELCHHTPDFFHGRTVAEIRADEVVQAPPEPRRARYRRTRVVRATFPPEYKGGAEGSEGTFTLRRIEYSDHPLSEEYALKRPEDVLEVWEILNNQTSDGSHGVVVRRSNPRTRRRGWYGLDGHCEAGYERLGHAVWDLACNGGLSWASSTGWLRRP